MPKFSEEALQNAIDEGQIRAVSLDSEVFARKQNDLNAPALQALNQINSRNISIIFSEMVAREVKQHIRLAAERTKEGLYSSLLKYHERWQAEFDIDQVTKELINPDDSKKLANDQFTQFINQVGAKILPITGNLNFDELMNRYFDFIAPFENTGNKKHEFPDAIALLSLEAWAKTEISDGFLLVVSNDGGWKKFAEESDLLFCVESIEDALDYFHSHRHDHVFVDRAVAMLRENVAEEAICKIDTAIRKYLDKNDFVVCAVSDFHYHAEWGNKPASLKDWQIPVSSHPRIIGSSNQGITFSIEIKCDIEFSATVFFYTSSRRRLLREHVNSKIISKATPVYLPFTVVIDRVVDPGPKFLTAQVSPHKTIVNLGSLRPSQLLEL